MFSLGGLKMSLSRSRPGNDDTELQDGVTNGGQRLGNFAIAATGPRDLGTHSEARILQTTTLTVNEDRRGDLVESGANT